MARVGALAGLLRLGVCFQGARETGRGVTGELRSPEPAEKAGCEQNCPPSKLLQYSLQLEVFSGCPEGSTARVQLSLSRAVGAVPAGYRTPGVVQRPGVTA